MLSRWPIRYKLLLVVSILFLIVAILAFSGFRGVYAYRELARSISYNWAAELRCTSELSYHIGELRAILSRSRQKDSLAGPALPNLDCREDFRRQWVAAAGSIEGLKSQLGEFERDRGLADDPQTRLPEWQSVQEIEASLRQISQLNVDDDWALNRLNVEALDATLADLHTQTLKLPFHLQQRMLELAGEVRGQYRTWIVLSWISSFWATLLLLLLIGFAYRAIFRPLQLVIQGSRRVARDGDFDHRICLRTHDEMAELAAAMNAMTERFQNIREDLDFQIRQRDELVRQRTEEVVRSEKMASLGLLAAGVAHEINNPMAAIAWCAESLESRLHDIIRQDDALPDEEHNPEIQVLRDYLRKIQDEAFRCKGITERLLDFSRLGDRQRHETELRELIEGVIEMVRHLGKFRQKHIEFSSEPRVVAAVNPQEMKQVVLNLITNALDSLDPGGTVQVRLSRAGHWARLEVEDNGCGMTPEVRQRLFEPFYTRRRDGQGTGLGLSISDRIIQDHGGEIVPSSPGPGCGSRFVVTLPLNARQEISHEEKRQVA